MERYNKNKKICLLAVGIVLVLLIRYLVPWGSIFVSVGTLMLEEPPKPEIEREEFDFTLVYKINGEKNVISDALICEFDGIAADEAKGKYRKWKSRLASGNTEIVLWSGEGSRQRICYNYEPPGYYMGDPDYANGNQSNYSDVILKKERSDSVDEEFISEKQLLHKYGIEIISWECEKPIRNVFE